MKQSIFIIAILILFASISFAEESPVALTLRMKGDITLLRSELESRLNEGNPLINQDVLSSLDDSFAFIKFIDDGATLRLFANSILTINTEREEEKMNKSSFLRKGNIFTSVDGRKGNFEVETPTTVASVRGTEGFIDVQDDGSTLIIALSGSFAVENIISGNRALVAAGNSCSSGSDGQVEVFPTEDIDEEWLEAIADMPDSGNNILRIELLDQENEKRTIEIELE